MNYLNSPETSRWIKPTDREANLFVRKHSCEPGAPGVSQFWAGQQIINQSFLSLSTWFFTVNRWKWSLIAALGWIVCGHGAEQLQLNSEHLQASSPGKILVFVTPAHFSHLVICLVQTEPTDSQHICLKRSNHGNFSLYSWAHNNAYPEFSWLQIRLLLLDGL